MANNINISYSLLGMLLLASSCSQEYVEGDGNRKPGDRIEFKAALPEVSTRASEVTEARLNDFIVSAFTVREESDTSYFANKTFSRNVITGRYVCNDPECIWPNSRDVLRFVAFYPSCEAIKTAGGDATFNDDQLIGIKIPQDITSHFDLVTAISTGNLSDDEETGVRLNFQHQLSRISLQAWGNAQSFDLEIAGVRIGGIGTAGTFSLTSQEDAGGPAEAGEWESVSKGNVQYIFQAGDKIVALDGTEDSPATVDKAVSILTANSNGYDNSAMIIPSDNEGWNYKDNASNGKDNEERMYISMLVRVTDDTPYSRGTLVYPSEEAENENVYLAIDEGDGMTVKTRVYLSDGNYYSDAACTVAYDPTADGAIVKAYGWAALPVSENFAPGRVYTYTLNYSYGVGLRDPHISRPGESIISDRVLIDVNVAGWLPGNDSDVKVPRK